MKGIWQPHESRKILADKEIQWTPEDICNDASPSLELHSETTSLYCCYRVTENIWTLCLICCISVNKHVVWSQMFSKEHNDPVYW